MRNFFIFSFVASLFLFASCEKTETFDDIIKIDNETQFTRITANSEYKKIESKTGAGHIMYKVLEESPESDVKPLFTDKVKVLYTGWYKHYWTREDEYEGDDGQIFKNKVIFDSTADRNDKPSEFEVMSVVDGFATALQHMNIGDKWEIWIPWELGYKQQGQGNVPGYTTMVFEVKLLEIINE